VEAELDGKIYRFEKTMYAKDLLKTLHLNREVYLVSVNTELVTGDYLIKSDEKAKIIRVVSGG
jgi:sulfur carrier protein ThiS